MRNIKQWIIFGLVGTTLIVGLIWLGSHSIIAVNTVGASTDGTYQVELTDAAGTRTSYEASSVTFKKIVPKGSYTVVVKDQGNYFKNVNTKGFLQTTTIDANLQAESQRTFIGDNPGPCMQYMGDRLTSNPRNMTAYDIQEHVMATAQMPTYTQRISTNELFGMYKGLITTKSGQHIMLQFDQEGVAGYRLQQVQPNFIGGERYNVPVENTNTEFLIKPFKDGFLVYSENFDQFLYYRNVSSQPEKPSINPPEEQKYNATNLTVASDTMTMAYTDAVVNEDVHEGESGPAPDTSGTGSEILVYHSANDQRHYAFDEAYTSATACSSTKLCAFNEAGMSVYDISEEKPKHLFDMPGVTEIQQTNNVMLAIAERRVYNLNADDASGFIDYEFGPYQYCGYTSAPNGYILCVFDELGNKSALYFDTSAKDIDAIDKKTVELREATGVDSVSTNGRYVYIAPEYGEPIYDPINKIYVPDPAKVRIANTTIDNAVTKIGFDKTRYTVINTGTQ